MTSVVAVLPLLSHALPSSGLGDGHQGLEMLGVDLVAGLRDWPARSHHVVGS